MAVTIDSIALKTATDRFIEHLAQLRKATGKTRQAMIERMSEKARDLGQQRTALADQLGTQLDWLNANPSHPMARDFEDRWLADLAIYEQASDALAGLSFTQEMAA